MNERTNERMNRQIDYSPRLLYHHSLIYSIVYGTLFVFILASIVPTRSSFFLRPEGDEVLRKRLGVVVDYKDSWGS